MTAVTKHEPREVAQAPERMAQPVEQQSETAAVLSMIERLAREPSVDIDRVERMMNLHRDMRREQAFSEFNVAMARIKSELPQVVRDAENSHTKSRYARLETISAAADPIISKHGISLSFGTDDSPLQNHYRVVCDVSLGAHTKRYHLDTPADGVGSGGKANKTAVQALGSALSYSRRYLKLMIFDIALTNEDNDGNAQYEDRVPDQREPSPEPKRSEAPRITPDQVQKLRDAIHDIGETEAKFCKAANIKSIESIWAADFKAAMDFVAQAGRK